MKISRLALPIAFLAFAVVAKADLIQNGNFSATNPSYPGYTATNAAPGDANYIAGWTSVSGGSNTSSGPFWDNGTAPAGVSSVGFIQGALGNTGTLTQTVNLTAGGVYQFSFYENARNCCAYMNISQTAGEPTLELLVDGTVVSAPTLLTPGGFVYVTGDFTATTSGPQDFTFSSTSPGDGTSLITDVHLSAVPEPSSLALLGTGLLGAVGFVRRKAFKA